MGALDVWPAHGQSVTQRKMSECSMRRRTKG